MGVFEASGAARERGKVSMTKIMRPGQVEPNDFELALLERIALKNPSLREHLANLHVLSREFTGVGSYTRFKILEGDDKAPKTHLGLDGVITMPNVENGMGAVLFCRGGRPECLETYTFGDTLWDGAFDGFAIAETG
jgi:hypothetical protein